MQTNWAGNYQYRAAEIAEPGSVDELQEIVARSEHVRALGSRHSFSDIVDSPGTLVEMKSLPAVFEIDEEQSTVTVDGGRKYGDVAAGLTGAGFALANMASLPHISVAGAVATGTHGSGVKNQSLSAAVTALEYVDPSGELRTVRKGDPDFEGHVVGLGALGIVTRLTLRIEPHYEMRQDLFSALPWSDIEEHFDEITAKAYSVSLFTLWGDDGVYQAWLKSRGADDPGPLFTAQRADRAYHIFPDGDAQAVTEQLGVLGSWQDRLPHFRMAFSPSRGEEIQSEYLLPRENALAGIEAMRKLGPQLGHVLQTSEIRTIAADDLWLSGCYERDTVGFHFTWSREPEALNAVLLLMEEVLIPLGARPHWGKAFIVAGPELEALYPRFSDFRSLRDRVDPGHKFGNGFLERIFGS